jgi:hypothetical protein
MGRRLEAVALRLRFWGCRLEAINFSQWHWVCLIEVVDLRPSSEAVALRSSSQSCCFEVVVFRPTLWVHRFESFATSRCHEADALSTSSWVNRHGADALSTSPWVNRHDVFAINGRLEAVRRRLMADASYLDWMNESSNLLNRNVFFAGQASTRFRDEPWTPLVMWKKRTLGRYVDDDWSIHSLLKSSFNRIYW